MTRSQRLDAFIRLGERLRDPARLAEREEAAYRANSRNNWFTVENCLMALDAIATQMLTREALSEWLGTYLTEPVEPRQIGVVMAGNIPAVGFHDMLCVLISGHALLAKLSSQDEMLMRFLMRMLTEIEPAFAERIQAVERLNAADAFIATGSDNSARYFEQYFSKKPHVIRRNRTSVAVLTGAEDDAQLDLLGNDLLTYYGLGCRNVSTLFVPDGYDGVEPYDFTPLLRVLEPRTAAFMAHHKYLNNYDYNKSIYLVNRVAHLDNGFLMVTEAIPNGPDPANLVSPISVVYYQNYRDQEHLGTLLAAQAAKIQVVASAEGWYPGSVAFGQTQRPSLHDYADGVDTMTFLGSLSS
jgi:hypothetical protein